VTAGEWCIGCPSRVVSFCPVLIKKPENLKKTLKPKNPKPKKTFYKKLR